MLPHRFAFAATSYGVLVVTGDGNWQNFRSDDFADVEDEADPPASLGAGMKFIGFLFYGGDAEAFACFPREPVGAGDGTANRIPLQADVALTYSASGMNSTRLAVNAPTGTTVTVMGWFYEGQN